MHAQQTASGRDIWVETTGRGWAKDFWVALGVMLCMFQCLIWDAVVQFERVCVCVSTVRVYLHCLHTARKLWATHFACVDVKSSSAPTA